MSREDTLALKKRLRRAWAPFFSQFGTLLPSQLAAVPRVLAGEDVFLSAATAGGKTEALVAPLSELTSPQGSGLAVVYVAPTRALVNDVEKRCRAPLEEMGLSCRVRTGERRELNEHLPSRFVITTPESLDSMLTRRPAMFSSLSALVLDELHLIDKTYRGDQVRLLIRRLAARVPTRLQVCGASATLDDAEAMARRYAGAPVIVDVGGNREIREQYFESLGAVVDALVAESRALKKILCFANSRKAVEERSAQLQEALPRWPVMVHHGSLDQRHREDAERALRDTARWICVATMTLEVGIDVGDVDAVLLLEPPWSVASLLQRIGRANRRSGVINVLALAGDAEQRAVFKEQFLRARQGLLDRREYRPDLSVVVQQVFAVLSGSPAGLADDALRPFFAEFCSAEELTAILDHLTAEGHLQRRRDRWYASAYVMDLAERGKVYSNVPDVLAKAVIDRSTGQRVGSVSDAVDSVFVLGGRTWRVVRFTRNEIRVEPTSARGGVALFQFQGGQGAFAGYLPTALRTSGGAPWS